MRSHCLPITADLPRNRGNAETLFLQIVDQGDLPQSFHLPAPRTHDWEIVKRLFWAFYIRRLQKRAMGEAGKLRAGGVPADRLGCRFEGMDSAALTAMGHLDQIGAKSKCAETQTPSLPGRTPRALRSALAAWPVVSTSMAETLTGARRAAVQRDLAWRDACKLIREVTAQKPVWELERNHIVRFRKISCSRCLQ